MSSSWFDAIGHEAGINDAEESFEHVENEATNGLTDAADKARKEAEDDVADEEHGDDDSDTADDDSSSSSWW